MHRIWNNLRMFLWLTLLTGIVYPLVVTTIAQLTMKQKADGDFLSVNGKIVGSRLIAQKFQNDKYFWPRPSSTDYNTLPSGGSNLGPTSTALQKAVVERKEAILKTQGAAKDTPIPSELLFASGSALDPHISPATAQFQIDRILKARNLDNTSGRAAINNLITKLTVNRQFGFIGDPYINVLELNIALDELTTKKS